MRKWMKDVPLTMDEVRALLKKDDKQSKWVWVGIGVSIICSLIAISLWICNKRNRDMEEYFEYFDDEDFDDYMYEDEYDEDLDHEVEYVDLNEEDEDEEETSKKDKKEEK